MSNQSDEYLSKIINESKNADEISDSVYKHVQDYLSSTDASAFESEKLFSNLAKDEENLHKKIFFLSVAVHINHSLEIFNTLLDLIWENRNEIEPDTLNFLYWQFIFYVFTCPELNNIHTKTKVWHILDYNISRYELLVQDSLIPIPINERDKDFVLVITDQFLSFQHGPSKTAADRCKILIEAMKKKVLLFNTGEVMSSQGCIQFYDVRYGGYNEELLNYNFVEWKGCKIPYFQCENNMPNIEAIPTILSTVRKLRPSYVITIGRGGILASLVAKIVPSLSIGLLPSGISISGIPFQTLSRPLNNDDRTLLEAVGRKEDSIIIGTFGSSILEQSAWYTREQVGLPSEAWLVALVGARLNQELTSEFWDMAEAASQYGVEYVILGSYDSSNLESVESSHPTLKGKIHNMGFVRDVLSYMDLCDIYINPIRAGGGTSCVEALSIGVPVITTPFGDVAVNVGEQFQTESYESMIPLIHRYTSDFDFYTLQSLAAKKRASELLNAEESFIKIISEFLERTN